MEPNLKEILEALSKPLPKEAIKPQTHKPAFSSINAVYVMERLNEVLGLDWELHAEVVDKAQDASKGKGYMVVVKARLIHRRFGIHREQFGGNDNIDLGDAYKGAVTDALTKIASGLGVGAHVFKGDPYPREYASKHEEDPQQKPANKQEPVKMQEQEPVKEDMPFTPPTFEDAVQKYSHLDLMYDKMVEAMSAAKQVKARTAFDQAVDKEALAREVYKAMWSKI